MQRMPIPTVPIVLATLALVALSAALAAIRLGAHTAFRLDHRIELPGAEPPGASPVDVTAILRRNIFDSARGDLTVTKGTADEPAPADPRPACDTSMRLVGALVDDRVPERSLASITHPSGPPALHRPGVEVEGFTLVALRPDRALLRAGDECLCTLPMFEPRKGPVPASRSAQNAPRRRSSRPAESKGITRVREDAYVVSRDFVDDLLANQADLMGVARVVPEQRGGRTVGGRLEHIRPGSTLALLGLENGDVLRRINGYDVSRPDVMVEAYVELRQADHLSVSILRDGTPRTLDYRIR